MLKINLSKDCWGSYSYFGIKDGKQYTEAYDTIEELKEDNPIFEAAEKIVFKNIADIKITLIGELNKVTSNFIDELIEADEPIYWNDSTCEHYIMMFKINGLWLESKKINNELTEIEFYICD